MAASTFESARGVHGLIPSSAMLGCSGAIANVVIHLVVVLGIVVDIRPMARLRGAQGSGVPAAAGRAAAAAAARRGRRLVICL